MNSVQLVCALSKSTTDNPQICTHSKFAPISPAQKVPEAIHPAMQTVSTNVY